MNKFFDKLNSRFTFKKYRLFLVAVMCIGLIMVTFGDKNGKINKTDSGEEKENVVTSNTAEEKKIEQQLEEILSEVSGVGKIKVFVTYESTDEKIVLKDKDGHGGENTVQYGGSSENQPFVYKVLPPEIGGVLIVSEGADDVKTKNDIADAVSTVLEIPLHKVKVLKMK